MKKYLFLSLVGALLLFGAPHAKALTCTNNFPSSLNSYASSTCIPSAWANALEQKLGADNSNVSTSVDYLLNNLFTSYRSDLIKATSTQGLLQVLNNLSDLLSTSTARLNLGLGTAATKASTDFLASSTPVVSSFTGQGCVTAVNSTGTVALTVSCISGNQQIAFTMAGDATGTATGTTAITETITVQGLNGKVLPANTTGTLQFSGNAWKINLATSSLGSFDANGNLSSFTGSNFTPGSGCLSSVTISGAGSLSGATSTCSGGGGGVSTSTSNTWAGVQAFGTSTVTILNGMYWIPLNVTSTGCAPFTNATDTGACVMSIYNSLASSTWGTIVLPPLGITASYSTPINFARNGVAVNLISFGGTSLYYNATGTALTVNTQNPAAHWPTQIGGFHLQGQAALIVAGQPNTATTTGIICGGTNGCVSVVFHDMSIDGFGQQIGQTSNAYMNTYRSIRLSGGNGGVNGDCMYLNPASNSGERTLIDDVICTDPGNATTSVGDIYIKDGAAASTKIGSLSLDDATIYNGYSNGTLAIDFIHCENSDAAHYASHPCIYATSSAASSINITSLEVANDAATAQGEFTTIILHGQNLNIFGWRIDNYGGRTVTYLADHSLNNGSEHENICGGAVQGGGLTNIVRNQAYSADVATGCITTYANSYPFTMYIDSANKVHIRNGNQDVGTVDSNGNWTFGGTAGSSAFQGNMTATGTITATGNIKTFNSFVVPPTISAVSTTLNGASAGMQVFTGTAIATATLPLTTATLGQKIEFKSRGTAALSITATSTDFIWLSAINATATAYSLLPGSSTAFINDGTYWLQLYK